MNYFRSMKVILALVTVLRPLHLEAAVNEYVIKEEMHCNYTLMEAIIDHFDGNLDVQEYLIA